MRELISIEYEDRTNNISWFVSNIEYFYLETYQRPFVWKIMQKIMLIDSIMMGIKIPGLFLHKKHERRNETPYYAINDGQQRLEAIMQFVNNKFPWIDTVNNCRIFYNNANDGIPSSENTRTLTEDEMRVFNNYTFQYTEFAPSCSIESMKENFKRINEGKHFSKEDTVGIYEDKPFFIALIGGIINIQEIDSTIDDSESLHELKFFQTFDISTFKKINDPNQLFRNNLVKLTEAHTRDMDNREVLSCLIPYIVASLNDQIIPYANSNSTNVKGIIDYLDKDFSDDVIQNSYRNLVKLTKIFTATGLPGTNQNLRSLRRWRYLPCIVAWEIFRNQETHILNWTNIISYFEQNEDRIDEFKLEVLGIEKGTPRSIGLIKTFYERIIDKYKQTEYPNFYLA